MTGNIGYIMHTHKQTNEKGYIVLTFRLKFIINFSTVGNRKMDREKHNHDKNKILGTRNYYQPSIHLYLMVENLSKKLSQDVKVIYLLSNQKEPITQQMKQLQFFLSNKIKYIIAKLLFMSN